MKRYYLWRVRNEHIIKNTPIEEAEKKYKRTGMKEKVESQLIDLIYKRYNTEDNELAIVTNCRENVKSIKDRAVRTLAENLPELIMVTDKDDNMVFGICILYYFERYDSTLFNLHTVMFNYITAHPSGKFYNLEIYPYVTDNRALDWDLFRELAPEETDSGRRQPGYEPLVEPVVLGVDMNKYLKI